MTIADQTLENGEGALVIYERGLAGAVSGDLQAGGVDAHLGLRINTTGGAVNETIVIDGAAYSIVFDTSAESIFEFFGSGRIQIADFVFIEGDRKSVV